MRELSTRTFEEINKNAKVGNRKSTVIVISSTKGSDTSKTAKRPRTGCRGCSRRRRG